MMLPAGVSMLSYSHLPSANNETKGWQELTNAVEEAGHMLTDETQIPWQDHFLGFTGYIDGIRSSDLTHPVMWGIDPRGRKFLCFRTLSYPQSEPLNKSVATLVIFERRGNNTSLAISSQNYEPGLWDETAPNQLDPEFQRFMNAETVEVTRMGKITCYRLDTERDEDAKGIDFQLETPISSGDPERLRIIWGRFRASIQKWF